MDLGDGTEYGKDMPILWAAHRAGSFGLPNELDQAAFAEAMLDVIANYESAWIAEDRNDAAENGRGPVCLLLVESDGTIIRPHANYFQWATPRNMLRCAVTFYNWVRYSKDVGLCVVKDIEQSRNLHWRMRDYGIMVTYVGNGWFVLAGEKK